MNDNKIINALECCCVFGDCLICPYEEATFDGESDCATKLHKDALDLINQQKEEIERLNAMIAAIDDDFAPLPFKNEFDDYIKKCKAEAIKEFAKMIKEYTFFKCGTINYTEACEIRRFVDNLVKEMTEGNDER